VSRFFKELTGLNPTDIAIQYFLPDAKDLRPSGGNVLLRNSEVAVTLWIAYHRLLLGSCETNPLGFYRKVYDPNQPGFIEMQRKLKELAQYAKAHDIRLYLIMTPDANDLVDNKFTFVHDIMRKFAEQNGYAYIDLLPAMKGLWRQETWAMAGDPHPNAFVHELMAEAIFPLIRRPPRRRRQSKNESYANGMPASDFWPIRSTLSKDYRIEQRAFIGAGEEIGANAICDEQDCANHLCIFDFQSGSSRCCGRVLRSPRSRPPGKKAFQFRAHQIPDESVTRDFQMTFVSIEKIIPMRVC
jgi:hypothetical protein